MSRHPASQLPNPFNRIEFGAIGWHKLQCHMPLAFLSPREVQFGMMVFDVVEDRDNLPPSMTASSPYLFEKGEERFPVEAFLLPAVNEFAVPDTHRTKVAYTFAGGMMQKNRIRDLRRNPHPASRTMLLESDLVHSPQVNPIVMRKFMEFFYMLPAVTDQRGPSSDEVYETETPYLEIGVGIAERPGKHPISAE